MPGFVIHLLHGKFILEKMLPNFSDDQVERFMQGILMPDSNTGKEKDISHFISPLSSPENCIWQIPDLGVFVSKYRSHLSEPFVLGYLAHLYLDKNFFKYFSSHYISFLDENKNKTLDNTMIKEVYITRNNEYISVDKLFSEEYMYGDYTKLNPVLIDKYSLEIPDKIQVKNPIDEVDLQKFEDIIQELQKYFSSTPSNNVQLKVFDQIELENFVRDEANEFIRYCQELDIDHNDGISPEDVEDAKHRWNEGMNLEDQAQDIDFDFKSEQYYRISWEQLCKQAHTHKAEDLMFMDRLILRARYVHKNKELQKKEYFSGQTELKKLALWTAIFNAVRIYHFNDLFVIMLGRFGDTINTVTDSVLNVICVIISAVAAWKTSIILIKSPKETWLRHMSFYSKITLEADRLFAGSGEYEGLSPKEKLSHFKAKNVTYTEDDYENFFVNMTGNKGCSDTGGGSEEDTKQGGGTI